jgi:predicted methyltransferase
VQINTWLKPKLFLFLKYDFAFDRTKFNQQLNEYKQWLKANPIKAISIPLRNNKTAKIYKISTKQNFSTYNITKLAKWFGETKVEKSLIQYKKRKVPSTELTVYHFLALDWYWNKQAIKHQTKHPN